jgi:DNA-binding MarR family transcriptional regulator
VEKQARAGAIDQEGEITLGLLQAVHENDSLTQRSAAQDLGIALGLANAYLKRCVKKGLIKVQQVPPNRYAYYLTPQGFAEKSRLTAEYLSYSFSVFRRARADWVCLFVFCLCRDRV